MAYRHACAQLAFIHFSKMIFINKTVRVRELLNESLGKTFPGHGLEGLDILICIEYVCEN